MNRSSFLQKLFASIAIGKLPVAITKDFRKIYLLQDFVAGFRYYEGMKMLEQMNEGDLLELKREPDNEYDECAVALHWQGHKIGFVPSSINEILSYLLDADALSLFGVITFLEKKSQPWENVAFAVYFIQEVNKDLPAHASYLTRIETPHYRTLGKKNRKSPEITETLSYESLFLDTNRVINLDTIPEQYEGAKQYFEQNYPAIIMNKPGRYVHVKDDGIYTYLYEVDDNIEEITSSDGKTFFEFFLV